MIHRQNKFTDKKEIQCYEWSVCKDHREKRVIRHRRNPIRHVCGAGNYLLYLRSALIYRTSCFSDTRNPRYYRSYHIKYQYPKMREGIGACNWRTDHGWTSASHRSGKKSRGLNKLRIWHSYRLRYSGSALFCPLDGHRIHYRQTAQIRASQQGLSLYGSCTVCNKR